MVRPATPNEGRLVNEGNTRIYEVRSLGKHEIGRWEEKIREAAGKKGIQLPKVAIVTQGRMD